MRPVAPIWAVANAAIALALFVGAVASRERVLHVWTAWDADWYERIAADGYREAGSPAFYPLYPATMRALSALPWVEPYTAGVIVSALSILAAYVLLYRLASSLCDEQAARRSVVYLAVFPTARGEGAPR